jgi:hypothetical protein
MTSHMNLRRLFYPLFVFELSLGDGWDPNDRFNPFRPRLGFPTSYAMILFVFSELKWEVIVGGIVDYH